MQTFKLFQHALLKKKFNTMYHLPFFLKLTYLGVKSSVQQNKADKNFLGSPFVYFCGNKLFDIEDL